MPKAVNPFLCFNSFQYSSPSSKTELMDFIIMIIALTILAWLLKQAFWLFKGKQGAVFID